MGLAYLWSLQYNKAMERENKIRLAFVYADLIALLLAYGE